MAFHDTINRGTTANDGTGDGLRTNLGKLHDNTKDNKQRLDDLNGNTPGVVSVNGVTTLTPLDASLSLTGSQTGAIKILIPNNQGVMLKLFIEVFDFSVNESFSITVSAYITGTSWQMGSVQIISSKSDRNLPVRFGHDGVSYCIYLGDLNSTWTHIKTSVVKGFFSYTNYQPYKWLTGWFLSLETSTFQNVSLTYTNNLPVAQ